MARAKNLSLPEPISFSVPKRTYEYLTWLAWDGRLGSNEPDVAATILVREIDRLLTTDYHKREIPQPRAPISRKEEPSDDGKET